MDTENQFNKAIKLLKQKKYTEVFDILLKLANQGHAPAQFQLGKMYDLGKGVDLDHQKAIEWYEKSADQGYINAQFSLGSSYYLGIGVEQDYRKAVEWYTKAEEQNDADYSKDGKFYTGVDSIESFNWHKEAAISGKKSAYFYLLVDGDAANDS